MVRTRAWVVAAGAVAGIVAVSLYATRQGRRAPPAEGMRAPPAETQAGPAPADAPPAAPPEAAGQFAMRADALLLALTAGGAPDAAAELRRLLRADEGSRRAAEAALLDPATPPELRRALSLVLGTLHGSDGVLLDALRRFAEDAAFVRCALLALGATREPEEEDDVFDLGDRPWGEGGPGGIGITVRREIDDALVRAEVARHFAAAEAASRRAAAVALRATIDRPDVRDAFLSTLRAEGDDGVAGVVGEALAQWAQGPREGGERAQVVEALLRRAGDEGLDGYRFRLEDDLARIPLGAAERTILAGLARPPHPLGIRSFAITAIGAGAARSGEEALGEARRLLGESLGEDADDAVRDMAARLLGQLPADEASTARLARAAAADPSWRVRYAAVEALGAVGGEAALAALRASGSDSDERVAGRARELLER